MAFPTTGIIDTFTGTNGDDLNVYSANWQAVVAGVSALEIQSNSATGTAAATCWQNWATNSGPDCEVYVTASTAPTSGQTIGVFARVVQESSAATTDGYCLFYLSGTLTFYRVTNGAQTAIGSGISQTIGNGAAFGFSSTGSTHEIFYKASGGSWTSLGTRSEATHTAAGKVSLLTTGTSVRFDDFGGGTINQFLTPGLFTNTQTFYAPTVGRGAVSLAPSLVTNSQTFYAPTVSSSYSLLPSLVTNSQTFYGSTISVGAVTLAPSLVTNSQTFYGPTISNSAGPQELLPSLVTNSQTFYGPTVSASYSLTPSLVTNSQTFYVATVSAQNTLAPSLVTNIATFYAPTVSVGAVTLQPSLVTNEQTFYAPTVVQQSNVELLPGVLTNEQVFFASLVELQSEKQGGDDAYHHTGWNKKAWKKKQKQEEALEETIRKTYRKVQGVEPTPAVIAELVEEVKEYAPEVVKPEKFDYSGVMEWLQAQESRVAQIIEEQQEEDDEEALLLLL